MSHTRHPEPPALTQTPDPGEGGGHRSLPRARRPGRIGPQPGPLPAAANDNLHSRPLSPRAGAVSPGLLRAALEHFARTGLGAADAAMGEAEAASARGDGARASHWLAVAALFDRRRAEAAGHPAPAVLS